MCRHNNVFNLTIRITTKLFVLSTFLVGFLLFSSCSNRTIDLGTCEEQSHNSTGHTTKSAVDETLDTQYKSSTKTGEANGTYYSLFGLYYEDVELHENGLLTPPKNGYEKILGSDEMKTQIGQEIAAVLDVALYPLSLSTDASTVAYYEDNTLCWGAELIYTSPYNEDISVTVAFNPDHQIIRGHYYTSPNLNSNYVSNVFASQPLTTSEYNSLDGASVSLGHNTKFLGIDERGNIRKADVLVAAFTHKGSNYMVEAVSVEEVDFLRIVYAILSV